MTFPIRVPAPCLALALLAGCASRSAPASYPANAALSPQAPEATPAHVTVALNREPPLPGENSAGWAGLGDAAHSAPPAHDHAAMGHDHAAMQHDHAPAQPQAPAPHDHAQMLRDQAQRLHDGGADAAH